jgi:UDP-N-acetylglucosamine 3-dehydrogenase
MSLRVGVIGVGAMGENHARNWSQMQVELVGLYDLDETRADAIAGKYDTRAFPTSAALLAEVDVVSIAVPSTLHHEYTLDALRVGVHVLVEKPIASTITQAEEMASTAEESGKLLMVGHSERFNPVVTTLKKRIDQGELGEIVSISAKRVGPHNLRIRDVGVIVDLGVHDIDVISFLYGRQATHVFAVSGVRLHPFEDYASISLYFPPDQVGVIDTNWLTPKKVRTLTAVGTQGVAEADYIDRTLTILRDEETIACHVPPGEPLHLELSSFLEAIASQRCPVDARQGIYNLKVALAAQESARRCESVEIG